jgi:hypothetical protein
MIENLLDVGFKESGWDVVLLEEAVDMSYAFFGVFLSRRMEDKII